MTPTPAPSPHPCPYVPIGVRRRKRVLDRDWPIVDVPAGEVVR